MTRLRRASERPRDADARDDARDADAAAQNGTKWYKGGLICPAQRVRGRLWAFLAMQDPTCTCIISYAPIEHVEPPHAHVLGHHIDRAEVPLGRVVACRHVRLDVREVVENERFT